MCHKTGTKKRETLSYRAENPENIDVEWEIINPFYYVIENPGTIHGSGVEPRLICSQIIFATRKRKNQDSHCKREEKQRC